MPRAQEEGHEVIKVSGVYQGPGGQMIEIREVYADNLEEEMAHIRKVVERYNYVAMDTEFPGIVARPHGEQGVTSDYTYQMLKCNVDMLKMIQLGLTFTDSEGNFPEGCSCWQFNFKFDLEDDMYAQDSIDLLKKSGIDFEQNRARGIEPEQFGEALMMSGLVLDEDVRWLSFHSSYDFGYMVKSLTCANLPTEEASFLELLRMYFPNIYDMKYMMMLCDGLHGGLQMLADAVQVERVGPMHQAGSDSLLTAQTFFKLMQRHFAAAISPNGMDDARFKGELFGLGSNFSKYRPQGGSQTNLTRSASAPAVFSHGHAITHTTHHGAVYGSQYSYVNDDDNS